MGFEYTLHHSIDEFQDDEWSCLHREDMDPRWDRRCVRVLERTLAGQAKYCYAVFRDQSGAPLADAHLSSSRLDLAEFLQGRPKRVIGVAARAFPGVFRPRLLCCELPPGFARWVARSDAAEALASLDRLLCRVAADEGSRWIALKDLTDDDARCLGGLRAMGYAAVPEMPMNHARPGYRDFEEFCAGESSQHRWTINRSRKKFAAAGLRVVRMTGGDGADRIFTDDVYRLYEAVHDHVEVKRQKVPVEFFRELARQIPDQSSFIFIYQGDRVVAFTCSLFNEAVYRSVLCGFDYNLNPRCDLYFNLSFFMMDDAYGRGSSQDIMVGATADAFKREKLGCYPQARHLYLKGTRRLIASLVLKHVEKAMAAEGGNGKQGAVRKPAVAGNVHD